MLRVAAFATSTKRDEHFFDHGSEFGAANEFEYETMAGTFLVQAKPIQVLECVRSRGDILRFDPITDQFGVLSGDGFIRTYFKPVPCAKLPAAMRTSRRCHSFSTNYDYFKNGCSK